MKLGTEDTGVLLDGLTGILLALRLLHDRTSLSEEQAGLVERGLDSAHGLERLVVAGIARRARLGGEVSHATVREQLSESLDGSLCWRERERLEAHLEGCLPCRAFGRTLGSTVTLLGELPRSGMPGGARQRLRELAAGPARQPDREPAGAR
jgi:hypothetical protein